MLHAQWVDDVGPLMKELFPEFEANDAEVDVWFDELKRLDVTVMPDAMRREYAKTKFTKPRLASVVNHAWASVHEERDKEPKQAQGDNYYASVRRVMADHNPALHGRIMAMDDATTRLLHAFMDWQRVSRPPTDTNTAWPIYDLDGDTARSY